MAKVPHSTESTLHIDTLKQGRIKVRIIGTTPLFYNSMSLKVKADLLLGKGKKTASERQSIKHNPEQEFNDSVVRVPDGPTFLGFPAPGIKNAMATAALVTDGVKKTDVQRMIFLPNECISIWGKPYLRMDVVRSADMNKTPDVRTRAFLPAWCSEVDIAFITPNLSAHAVTSLLANAGVVCGIGDFRQEKGKGAFGTFAVVSDEEQEAAWELLTKSGGREAQQAAMAEPTAYNEETRSLWTSLRQERLRRAA
jgi:hypothetical protein